MALEIVKPNQPPLMLRLIRHLYEEDGDRFAMTLAEYIKENQLLISEEALMALVNAIKSIRI